FKISLSETTIAMPPYLPVFSADDGLGGLLTKARQLSFESYLWLLDDALYINAYISSLVIAGVSTFLALLVGYPLAYAMARAPGSMRMILLMLVILPFWTSFLIRVYAWIDRQSTRLNSSHVKISYAVFCLKKEEETGALAGPAGGMVRGEAA